jgi:hypothetical protein
VIDEDDTRHPVRQTPSDFYDRLVALTGEVDAIKYLAGFWAETMGREEGAGSRLLVALFDEARAMLDDTSVWLFRVLAAMSAHRSGLDNTTLAIVIHTLGLPLPEEEAPEETGEEVREEAGDELPAGCDA